MTPHYSGTTLDAQVCPVTFKSLGLWSQLCVKGWLASCDMGLGAPDSASLETSSPWHGILSQSAVNKQDSSSPIS